MTWWVIASQVMRQTRRHRVQGVLIAFALLMVGASLLFSSLSYGVEYQVIRNVGLMGAQLLGFLVTTFGIVLFYTEELEGRGAILTLAKPVSRGHYILGWFAGLALTLVLYILIMGLILEGLLSLLGSSGGGLALAELWITTWKLLMTLGLSFFLCTVVTSLPMAILVTVMVYLLGHIVYHLKILAQQAGLPFLELLATLGTWLLPNFHAFRAVDLSLDGVSMGDLLMATTSYGALYTLSCVALAFAVFKRREF